MRLARAVAVTTLPHAAAASRCMASTAPSSRSTTAPLCPLSASQTSPKAPLICAQAAHNGQIETSRRRSQRIGETLGRFFEARVKELCHDLGRGHWVIGSDDIDAVTNRQAGTGSKRADMIIGNIDGRYLVVEATKRNLRPEIRYGDRAVLDEWADDHLGKLEQARTTAQHIWAITAACGMPSPRSVSCLVVGDLPLRQDIGLSALFAARSDTRLPPFLCGIIEFETLIELGQGGWSVPSVVSAWQSGGSDVSLGYYLSDHPGS